jgi:hypothetical protein
MSGGLASGPASDQETVIRRTRAWIASIVIGLDLCPFAQRVFQADRIRYHVTDAADAAALWSELARELEGLATSAISCMETSLLIHPRALQSFLDYNDFVAAADGLIKDLGLRGTIQIAGFHPEYQFAGTDADAVENYTNRSPYPMLHLLREQSITAVATNPDRLAEIPQRNIETLRRLGRGKILEKLHSIAE